MEPGQVETLNFDDLHAPIRRVAKTDTYIALTPPDASPVIVAQTDMEPDAIIAFVTERIGIIREMRTEMLKRYAKSPSLKCRYQTGDVLCLLGRPFMLRVFPLPMGKRVKGGSHGRVNVNATMHNDLSLIDLYLMQVNNHDQARAAYLSYANPVLEQNARGIVKSCCIKAGLPERFSQKVRVRPMRTNWVRIDEKHGEVWISENLSPFPPDCVAYAFLSEAATHVLGADATNDAREAFIETGLPTWKTAKKQLEDPDSAFRRQLGTRP